MTALVPKTIDLAGGRSKSSQLPRFVHATSRVASPTRQTSLPPADVSPQGVSRPNSFVLNLSAPTALY